jgi:DNA-binding FrmR family transcriptional regulator
MAEQRGYSVSRDDLLKRLRKVEGQVGGIGRMVEEDRYCIDVVTQINAARAALDKIALGLLDAHARHCLSGGRASEGQTDELISTVARMLSR